MKINATFDQDGYLYNFAIIGKVDGGTDVEVPEGVSEDELMENYAAYRLENGALVLDEDKLAGMEAAAEQAALTARYIPSEAQSAVAVGRLMLAQMAGLDDDTRIRVSGLYEPWQTGKYEAGDIRNSGEQTWECFQAHDCAVYPDIKPGSPAWYTFWRPLHGKTIATARPYVPVQGGHDIYRSGEYMVYTDGKIYKCKQDTNFSPDDYAPAWEVVRAA